MAFAHGTELFEKGYYEESILLFQELLTGRPALKSGEAAAACFQMSRALKVLGRQDEVLPALLKALEYALLEPVLAFEIGLCFRDEQKWEQALHWLQLSLDLESSPNLGLSPDFSLRYPALELLRIHYREGRLDQAFAYHQQAKAFAPFDQVSIHNSAHFQSLGFVEDEIYCEELELRHYHEKLGCLEEKAHKITHQVPLVGGYQLHYTEAWEPAFDAVREAFEKTLIRHHILKTIKDPQIRKLGTADNCYRCHVPRHLSDAAFIYKIQGQDITFLGWDWHFVVKNNDVILELAAIEERFPAVLNTSQTLKHLIDNNASIARFGDGELNLALGFNIGFQTHTPALSTRLREILAHPSDHRLLVAIPEFNSQTNNQFNLFGQLSFWENFWRKKYPQLASCLLQPAYGNPNISRSSVFAENSLAAIQKLWEGRQVVFVYGKGGRFQTQSSLFAGITGMEVVETPPVNAFETYDQILADCMEFPEDRLYILACGPTATVLAYDLSQAGRQALDLGHLPNCYDEYLGRAGAPETLPLRKEEP